MSTEQVRRGRDYAEEEIGNVRWRRIPGVASVVGGVAFERRRRRLSCGRREESRDRVRESRQLSFFFFFFEPSRQLSCLDGRERRKALSQFCWKRLM